MHENMFFIGLCFGLRGGFLDFILYLKAGGDITTLGVVFVAKWCNIGSCFVAFIKGLHFFGGGEHYVALAS